MNAAALPESHSPKGALPEPIEPVRFDATDLDPNGDPRIDLDAFVNARWRARNPVPPDRSYLSTCSRTQSDGLGSYSPCNGIASAPS